MKMEVEEQWRKDKRVVGEKERAEKKNTYFGTRDKYEML